jgi:hypothetical protein
MAATPKHAMPPHLKRIRTISYLIAGPIGAQCSQANLNRGLNMRRVAGGARVGQWYLRLDKGEIFQVIGYDGESLTIEIQNFDGDLDEIDEEAWATLPLGLAEPPEDWTGPIDDVRVDDLGYSETDMTAADWTQLLKPFRPARESWEETGPDVEAETEGLVEAALID